MRDQLDNPRAQTSGRMFYPGYKRKDRKFLDPIVLHASSPSNIMSTKMNEALEADLDTHRHIHHF